jgi:hypothetical protein
LFWPFLVADFEYKRVDKGKKKSNKQKQGRVQV